jgi:hypothetical protein
MRPRRKRPATPAEIEKSVAAFRRLWEMSEDEKRQREDEQRETEEAGRDE